MADTYSTESIEQAAERRGRKSWPASLLAAAAVDDLAKALYTQRCYYNCEQPQKWQDVPFNLRSGYFELAKRTLDGMGEPTSANVDDSLFTFASSVARAEAARVTSRREVVTGLGGKIIGSICAADVVDGRD